MTTRSGGEEHDTEGNPFNGKYLYIGRKGLADRLDLLHTDDQAITYLTQSVNNRVWRCYIGEVTEMNVTEPVPPLLIARYL